MINEDLNSVDSIISMGEELDFKKFKDEIIQVLDKSTTIVLATSNENRVTSRTIWMGNNGLELYFISWKHNKKISQIKENPKVALTLRELQFEGVAEILGHPFKEKNKNYLNFFYKKIPQKSIDAVAKVPEVVMVKIEVNAIVKLKTINKKYYLQNMDLEREKVFQMRIEDKDNLAYPY